MNKVDEYNKANEIAERCDELNQELYDNKCVMEFVQSQANEMYMALNGKKMTIDELA